MDRLEALHAFVAVADRGGFSAAARSLRLSSSAVSRAVASLEARLGARLLNRTTRTVRLTEEGALFLPRCREALAGLAEAERQVMGAVAEPGGTLVVAAPVVWGRLHAVPIVAAMLDAYPGLSVQLRLSDRLVSIAEDGIDVAMRIGELKDSAMRAVRVGEVRRVLAASPAYLAARPAPSSVADLRAHHIIAFTGTSPLDEWRFGRDGRTSVPLHPRLVVDSADAAIEAALLGVGVGMFLSYQVEEHIAAGRLVALLDDGMPPALPVHLVFQGARAAAPNIRAFVEAATMRLRS